MKSLLVISTIFIIACLQSSCTRRTTSSTLLKNDSLKYVVYKIDSINNYYLIYAKKGNSIFKIVSKKENFTNCTKIKIGEIYDFGVHSLLHRDGEPIIPASGIYEVSGWAMDNSTIIPFEGDSIRDLFTADNLKGLCLIRTKKSK